MNILICDTSEFDTKCVADILNYSYDSKMKVTVFRSTKDALSHIRTGADVDLCFLETVTPEMDGIELARALRADGYKGEIAFVSESNRYGPESYEVKAIDYVRKPVMSEEIKGIVKKVMDKRERADANNLIIYNTIETVPYREKSRIDRIKQFLYGLLN